MTTNSPNDDININNNALTNADDKGISITSLLRGAGAFAVIASLSLFTLQGWSEGNDINRYLTLLSQTGLLVASGFLLNWLIKEQKGARMFFILALGSVLANVTILSALLYSFAPLDHNLVDYPDMMRWVATSPSSFIPLAATSMAVLTGFSYFAFSILARPIAKPLTISLLGLSLVLLLPIREPLFALGLAALALIIASKKIKDLNDRKSVFKTLETRIAFAILYLPSIIIIARAVLLYPIEPLVFSVFSLLFYAGVRYWRRHVGSHFLVEAVSTTSIFLTAYSLGIHLESINASVAFFACVATILTLSVDQMRASANEKIYRFIALVLSGIVAPIVLLTILLDDSLINVCIALAANGSILAINLWRNKQDNRASNNLLITSTLMLIATSLVGAMVIIETIALGNWILLGLIGVLMIFSSSLLEWYKTTSKKLSHR